MNYIYKNVILGEKLQDKKNKDRIPGHIKENIRKHINTLPKIESHYCRSTSKKWYLDRNLNIQKMYELYETDFDEKGLKKVKASMYHSIFVNEFNLDFHIPKMDRCDSCEEMKTVKNNRIFVSEEHVHEHNVHITEKTAMRSLLNKHREAKEKLVIKT